MSDRNLEADTLAQALHALDAITMCLVSAGIDRGEIAKFVSTAPNRVIDSNQAGDLDRKQRVLSWAGEARMHSAACAVGAMQQINAGKRAIYLNAMKMRTDEQGA